MLRLNPSGHSNSYYIVARGKYIDEVKEMIKEIEADDGLVSTLDYGDKIYLACIYTLESLSIDNASEDVEVKYTPDLSYARITLEKYTAEKLIQKALDERQRQALKIFLDQNILIGEEAPPNVGDLSFGGFILKVAEAYSRGVKRGNISLYLRDRGMVVTIPQGRYIHVYTLGHRDDLISKLSTYIFIAFLSSASLRKTGGKKYIYSFPLGEAYFIYTTYGAGVDGLKTYLQWRGIVNLLYNRYPEYREAIKKALEVEYDE